MSLDSYSTYCKHVVKCQNFHFVKYLTCINPCYKLVVNTLKLGVEFNSRFPVPDWYNKVRALNHEIARLKSREKAMMSKRRGRPPKLQ